MDLRVETVSPAEHLAFLRSRESASFLTTPAWGEVKKEWRSESIGWRDASGQLVGAALVLYRRLPAVLPLGRAEPSLLRRSFAYLPEGPVIDWSDPDLGRWLRPLASHVASNGAFAIRMGPPVVARRWTAGTVKDALAQAPDGGGTRLDEVPPDSTEPVGAQVANQLSAAGWRPPSAVPGGGFAPGQPRHVFWLPLDGRSQDDVLAGMNQQWRRNIRKAAKAGVEVTVGSEAELPDFHKLYLETTERDHFTPRPLEYFERMYRSLVAEDPERLRLYLAHHEGDLVAATIGVRVGRHAWYSYGASSTHKREVRGSNAVQWRMITDALADGAAVYDLRGITDTLDASDPHVGLLQFKVGTGGEAVEYIGEWDLPISRLLYTAFDLYLRRRGG